MTDQADAVAKSSEDRVWTIPNALSLLRLLGVPLFLWLVLGPKADGWAVVVLMVAGFTDWLDGKLARAFNQTSRLGRLLDPAADRLYILATLVGLTVRDIIPVWLVAVLLAREIVVGLFLLVLGRYGYVGLPVHFLGKAATANLLYAFPLLFLGVHIEFAKIVGWAFAIWGTGLYWWAGVLYLVQGIGLIRSGRRGEEAA
ncbi:CDP-alcohol phosphatidyltransferase family protein [Bailinhaonella thermotolerans]|uniref:CDP-alcohol phosphatidyltransferase family protein n=1 Tax=Bailinhaonella thermotolerans TaxID=1070861 RepID=A0A3A4A7D0_9ACTN|nr:CDP-alcohol phosphatidyltransferase family protein [Bailinhaonella thermotolerans]RJL20855.1 CDP-alcohol phosphatidyltransferase family protein [Bailinhaonella thermotolerans]